LLPGSGAEKDHSAFPCTALGSVRSLPPKRSHGHHAPAHGLVKQGELPSTLTLGMDEMGNPTAKRAHGVMTAAQKAELLDEESEEEDFDGRPMKLKDLRAKAEQAALKRRRQRGQEKQPPHAAPRPAAQGAARPQRGSESEGAVGGHDGQHSKPQRQSSHGGSHQKPQAVSSDKDDDVPEDLSATSDEEEQPEALNDSTAQDPKALSKGQSDTEGAPVGPTPRRLGRGKLASQTGDDIPHVTEEEIDRCFLQRYKMTREELQVMADHMQIHVNNLCLLKQEFDFYDQDQSGYVEATELKGLLKKLGEDLSDEALDRAFKQLDSDGSGEIEFFEFAEWFTSADA